jgi:hypothetical protein
VYETKYLNINVHVQFNNLGEIAMWIIIFFAVIGAIVGHVLAARQHATAKEQYFFAPFFGSAVGIFLISFVMLFFIADRLPTKWVTESSAKLVSLRDKSSVDGSFILGTGNIAEKDYFVYYREWGGGFKKEKLPADNSVIFEGSQSATLVVKKRVYEEEWMNSFFIRNDAINVRSYEFHVPKGTIMQKFSVE